MEEIIDKQLVQLILSDFLVSVTQDGFIDLKGKDDFCRFVISNSMGQIIRSGDPADFPLEISTWDRGIYVIRLEKESEIITRKLIIK